MSILKKYFLFFLLLNLVCLTKNDKINLNKEENNIYAEIRNFLNLLKSNPNNILNKEYMNDTITNFAEKYNITFINPMIDDLLFNESKTFVNDTFDVVKNNISDINVLDYIINILDYLEVNKNINMSIVFYELHNFVNYPGMDKVLSYFREYSNVTYGLFEKIISFSKYSDLYFSIDVNFMKYSDILQKFFYDFLRYYNDTYKLAELVAKFFNDNYDKDHFTFELFINLDLPQLKLLSKLIHFSSHIFEAIKEAFFEDYSTAVILFEPLFWLKETIIIYLNLIKNWGDEKYFFNYLPEAIRIIKEAEKFSKDLSFLLNYMSYDRIKEAIIRNSSVEDYLNLVTGNLMKKAESFFMEEGLLKNDFSEDCKYLINNVYFSNYTYTTAFFLKKVFIDSTKNKNDFLTYENCIEKKDFPEIKDLNFTVKPIFVIGIVDDIKNKNKFKNSLLNEKYNYISSLCFPYGLYKEDNKEMCSTEDYNKLIKATLRFVSDMNTSEINTFNIKDNKFLPREYFYCILSIILILSPLIIRIFIFLYKIIQSKRYENENKLINVQENSSTNSKKAKLISEKYNPPNWYKYLFSYFNIKKNLMELFNFNSNETHFNNFNGITYIKGILGISMFLYILGLIFLILFNFPIKITSQFSLYNTIANPFYIFIFLAVRYFSRMIFSCSGYILSFKFISFIEQEQKNYFFKFLFRQSYKYILLILVALFMRYSLYYIDTIISGKRHPLMEIYRYNLKNNDKYFFGGLFSFLLFSEGNNEFKKRQNLIQYFYLPLNEMFLFIFGILLLSIGYKYKLRIDYIIIILGIILYIIKIIIGFNYYYNKDYFPTLYFYLYNYGELMLNPLFNLPYYLIGMYFGLINFAIQKGIALYKMDSSDSYSLIEMIEKHKDKYDEESYIKNNDDNDNTNIVNNIEFDKLNLDSESQGRRSFDNSSSKSVEEESELNNSYKLKRKKKKVSKPKKKSNESYQTREKNINNENSERKGELNEKIKEMPFLISPLKFLNFHRRINRKNILRIGYLLIFFIILFISLFHITIILRIRREKQGKNIEIYSLEDMISNNSLNIFYFFDIEIIIFLFNYAAFIIYSIVDNSSDMIDFINNRYWSFFSKCYFSFTVISTPIIIYIFYQSESAVGLSIGNIFLYFSIDIFFILLGAILFYSCFEFPFKKIFKTYFIKEEIINIEYEEEKEENINEQEIDQDDDQDLISALN